MFTFVISSRTSIRELTPVNRELVSAPLRVRPVAQNCSKPGGIDIGYLSHIDNRIGVPDLPQRLLQHKQGREIEWPLQAKNCSGAGSA